MYVVCLCVVWQDKKCVGAKEEVSLSTGDAVFGAHDNRVQYGGKGASGSSKGDGKGKATKQCSAKFETPMVLRAGLKGSVSDGASHDGGAKKSVKGEKSKKKILSSPSASSDAGSAAGGGKGGESSTDDNDGVDNGVYFPKNKLGDLCRHLGKGRGECIKCVVLL